MNTPTIYPRESSGANRFFLLSMLCISTVLLASCGGGSGEEQTSDAKSADGRKEALAVPPGWKGRAPTYEVINGITVPPEPAPSINNATLTGVDINKNGVRDDVERKIALAASSQGAFQISMLYASRLQSILQSNIPETSEEAQRIMLSPECAISGQSLLLINISYSRLIFNTNERQRKIKAISKLVPAMTVQGVDSYVCP